jgi:hypothetical protein
MSNAVPEFVLSHGASIIDWIEQDDRLFVENQTLPYHKRNQQDWWLLNKKIRDSFNEIEHEIKHLAALESSISVRLVSWSSLSHKLSCDRATLKHPKRYYWVNAKREQMLQLIKEANKQEGTSLNATHPEVSELAQLKANLFAQRTQTALWYDKYLSSEDLVAQLKRLLVVRDARIKQLLSDNLSYNQQDAN